MEKNKNDSLYLGCIGHEELTRMIIENGADINAKAHGGRKALKSI